METAVEAVNAGALNQKFVFGYDPQGRRITKIISNWNGTAWIEISNLKFVYDGWNLLAELDKTNAPVRSYAWGIDLGGNEQAAGGVGGLLSVTSHQSPLGTYFVSYDGNGNVAALLSAQSAKLSANYEYSPFGETLRATGNAAKLNPFRFSSKYTDETGLLYYGYRYYAPSTGRWLSRDPIEESGGRNLYAFVGNNPVKFSDPLGLAQLWFFTGVNSWQGGTKYTSIGTTVERNWHYWNEPNLINSPRELISGVGIGLRYLWPFDEHQSLLVPWSGRILDNEASRMAEREINEGDLCCSRIRVLMIAPKTNAHPPNNSCCETKIAVYVNPFDYVPNQEPFNPSREQRYWEEWGETFQVDTRKGHDFRAFLENPSLPIMQWSHQYLREASNLDPSGRWQRRYVPAGKSAPSPIDNYLRPWMNDPKIDHIFVCHSQGCNIAMHILLRGCTSR
jgi:RHS repeat-associated protein